MFQKSTYWSSLSPPFKQRGKYSICLWWHARFIRTYVCKFRKPFDWLHVQYMIIVGEEPSVRQNMTYHCVCSYWSYHVGTTEIQMSMGITAVECHNSHRRIFQKRSQRGLSVKVSWVSSTKESFTFTQSIEAQFSECKPKETKSIGIGFFIFKKIQNIIKVLFRFFFF